jgi:isocitrate dehydrogenase
LLPQIFFGHAVTVFFKDLFAKHGDAFKSVGVNPTNGFGDVLLKIKKLDAGKQAEILADIDAVYASRPGLAMVDSSKGITNLHTPSDIIIDASMPCVVRDSGRMWNAGNKLQDVVCLIPDRSYAGIYDEVMRDCATHGQFNVQTMGSTANVGLMAQKAEEYGSHDKTFEMAAAGTVRVKDIASGAVLFEHAVEAGDVWRMCQTKDASIKGMVSLRACADFSWLYFSSEQNSNFADPVPDLIYFSCFIFPSTLPHPSASPPLALRTQTGSSSPSRARAPRATRPSFGSTRRARTTRS